MKKELLLLVCIGFFLQFHAKSAILKPITIDSVVYALDTSTEEATVLCFQKELTKAKIKRNVEYNGVLYNTIAIFPYYNFSSGEYNSAHYTITLDELEIEDSVNIKWPNPNIGYSTSAFTRFNINKLHIGRGVRIRLASTSTSSGSTPFTGIKEIYCTDYTPIPCILYSNGYLFPLLDQELKVYVPKGSERTYMYSCGWGNVDQIIGLEELGHVNTSSLTQESLINFNQRSSIIDNNTDESLPLTLENKVDIKSIEFDMILPQGVSLSGDDPIQKASRTEDFTFTITDNNEGTYHVSAFSSSVLPYGKGDIANITIRTNKSDSYIIQLKNAVVTTTTGSIINLDENELQFVANHVKGDYNDDGRISISDVTMLIEYLLRR